MKAIESYLIQIKGKRPLLMHSPTSMETKAPAKRRGERPDPKIEAKKALYRDPMSKKICFPAFNIKSCMKNAAKEYKVPGKGRKTFMHYIMPGLAIEPDYVPLITPRDPEKDWEIDKRPVVVQRARIIRARPRFDSWELELKIHILDPIIKKENIRTFLEDAGKYIGLGDFRPEFGLFELVKFEKIE